MSSKCFFSLKRFSFTDSRPAPKRGGGPLNRHAWPPINKVTLLKTAAFVLNFKLWPLPDKHSAPLSQLLCPRFCTDSIDDQSLHKVQAFFHMVFLFFSCRSLRLFLVHQQRSLSTNLRSKFSMHLSRGLLWIFMPEQRL